MSGHSVTGSAAASASSYLRIVLPVASRLGQVGVGRLRAGDQHVGDGLEGRQQLGERRQQARVDHDDLVLGVVGDVGDLVGEEPDVEGVQHRAHRRHGQVDLEVLGVVPHEGRDPLVAVDAAGPQGSGQAAGSLGDVGERTATGAVRRGRDDLGVGVHAGGVLEEAGDAQRGILHGALHGTSMPRPSRWSRRDEVPSRGPARVVVSSRGLVTGASAPSSTSERRVSRPRDAHGVSTRARPGARPLPATSAPPTSERVSRPRDAHGVS